MNGQACLCTKGAECFSTAHTGFTTGCCAPATDSNGNPIGPFECKPQDGKAYDCGHNGSCPAGFCQSLDSGNGYICMEPCTNASQCGTSGAVCTTLQSGACNTSPMVCWVP